MSNPDHTRRHFIARSAALGAGLAAPTLFADHHGNKKGFKISSNIVEKYGMYLRPSLYNSLNPLTREEALALSRVGLHDTSYWSSLSSSEQQAALNSNEIGRGTQDINSSTQKPCEP